MYSSDRRIARNTLYLYGRMLLTVWISLYTSRLVLERLGVDDYGVYSVVGGIGTILSSPGNDAGRMPHTLRRRLLRQWS